MIDSARGPKTIVREGVILGEIEAICESEEILQIIKLCWAFNLGLPLLIGRGSTS